MKPRQRSLSPLKWGEQWWIFLHGLPLYAPQSFRDDLARSFLIRITDLLPCTSCSSHYADFIHYHPLSTFWTTTPIRIAIWLNHLHNNVNRRNLKPNMSWKVHNSWRHEDITPLKWKNALFSVCYYVFAHLPSQHNDTVLVRSRYRDFVQLLVEILDEIDKNLSRRFYTAFIQQNPELCTSKHRHLRRKNHDVWSQTFCLQTTLHHLETKGDPPNVRSFQARLKGLGLTLPGTT